MSDFATDETPKKGSKRLDTFQLVTEYAMALENKGDGKVDWNAIAQIIGSASGQAALKCWQGIKKKNEAAKKEGAKGDVDNEVLKSKASKVEKKPRANKKAATTTPSEGESPKATKKATATKKSTSPAPTKSKRGRKAAKKDVKTEADSDGEKKTASDAKNVKQEDAGEEVEHTDMVQEDEEDQALIGQDEEDNTEVEIGAQ